MLELENFSQNVKIFIYSLSPLQKETCANKRSYYDSIYYNKRVLQINILFKIVLVGGVDAFVVATVCGGVCH